MDPIVTSIITGIIGIATGLISKILWDWLKIRRDDNENISQSVHVLEKRDILYHLQQDLALIKQTLDTIENSQTGPEIRRLLEESHTLFEDRSELKTALDKQNTANIATNLLLHSLQNELAKTTAQLATMTEGLVTVLRKIKES